MVRLDPFHSFTSKATTAALLAITPRAVQNVLLREREQLASLDGPSTFQSAGSTESPARTTSALILGRVDDTLVLPVDVGRESLRATGVDGISFGQHGAHALLTTELVGVHQALNFLVVHVSELSDAKLVGDISAAVVGIDHLQVLDEGVEAAMELFDGGVVALVLVDEGRELGMSFSASGDLEGRLRSAREQVQAEVVVERGRADGLRGVLHGVRAHMGHVEVVGVRVVGTVVRVVDDIVVGVRAQHEVEAMHVQTHRRQSLRVQEHLVLVRHVVLHIRHFPVHQLTVRVVTLVHPAVVHDGQNVHIRSVRVGDDRSFTGLAVVSSCSSVIGLGCVVTT